jgi:hypothetical protein
MCGLKTGTDPVPEVRCFIYLFFLFLFIFLLFIFISFGIRRYGVARSVEALRYKPEGRGYHSRWGYWDFSLT